MSDVNARIWIAIIVVLGTLSGRQSAGQGANATAPAAPQAAVGAPMAGEEVTAFVRSAAATSPGVLHVASISMGEGRESPLVVAGAGLADGSAKAVRSTTKTRVWVQAGSRDGTDATLMLIRDLAAGRHDLWMTSIVLLVSPVEVNRNDASVSGDQVMLTSPETRAFTKALVDYDPHATIEIRTEDGPCSGFAVTFSPPLNPNTSEHILGVLRDEWFPFVIKNLKNKRSLNAFYRGTVDGGSDGCAPKPAETTGAPAPVGRRGAGAPAAPSAARGGRAGGRGPSAAKPAPAAPAAPAVEPAWTAPSPRLGVTANYLGARNRFAVVGVVHARDSAGDRASAASQFLEEALGFAWAASVRIMKACQDADAQLLVGRSLPTSARPLTIGQVDVLMSAPSADGTPSKRTASATPVTMRDRLRYEPASDEVLAAEYFLPATETAVIDLLRHHGIQVRQLTQPTKGVEEFVVPAGGDATSGGWKPTSAAVPAGSWVIRMNQPLARLAFALIEPTSDEAVMRRLRPDGAAYTVMRRR
jgi:hypothetical protein